MYVVRQRSRHRVETILTKAYSFLSTAAATASSSCRVHIPAHDKPCPPSAKQGACSQLVSDKESALDGLSMIGPHPALAEREADPSGEVSEALYYVHAHTTLSFQSRILQYLSP